MLLQLCLTVNRLKMKRPPIVKKFRALLDDMYAQLAEEQSAPKAKL